MQSTSLLRRALAGARQLAKHSLWWWAIEGGGQWQGIGSGIVWEGKDGTEGVW